MKFDFKHKFVDNSVLCNDEKSSKLHTLDKLLLLSILLVICMLTRRRKSLWRTIDERFKVYDMYSGAELLKDK